MATLTDQPGGGISSITDETETDLTGFLIGNGSLVSVTPFGSSSGTVCQGNDSRLSDARTPTAHTHAIGDVTSLQTELDGKAATSHTQAISTVTGLQTALDGKAPPTGNNEIGAKRFTSPIVDKGTVSTGTVTFAQSDSEHQRLQVGGNLTIATGSWPTTGTKGQMVLELVNAGSASVTFPTWVWYGTSTATPPFVFPTSGTAFVYLWSTDGGTTVRARLV